MAPGADNSPGASFLAEPTLVLPPPRGMRCDRIDLLYRRGRQTPDDRFPSSMGWGRRGQRAQGWRFDYSQQGCVKSRLWLYICQSLMITLVLRQMLRLAR